jgi:hypothetical protein
MQPSGVDHEAQISGGMRTTTVMIKRGAAKPAAVSRMTPANNPATQKMSVDFQYLARLIRPLSPNKNSNSCSRTSGMETTGQPGPGCVAG